MVKQRSGQYSATHKIFEYFWYLIMIMMVKSEKKRITSLLQTIWHPDPIIRQFLIKILQFLKQKSISFFFVFFFEK